MILHWLYVLLFPLNVSFAQKIRILVVLEKDDFLAENSVKSALDFLKNDDSSLDFESTILHLTNDPYESVSQVCNELEEKIANEKSPNLLVDLTKNEANSKVIKSLSQTLKMPTLSSNLINPMNKRDWDKLNEVQKQYLVQVLSPNDVIPNIVRVFCVKMNITNAAILFDKTFEIGQNHKTLLLNLPVRHIIQSIEEVDIEKQLRRLEAIDIQNYFIFGSKINVKKVLQRADNLKMFGEKYAWFAGSKEHGENIIEECCANAEVIYFFPELNTDISMKQYKYLYENIDSHDITAAFYFDLVLMGVKTLSKEKNEILNKFKPQNCNYPNEKNITSTEIDFLSKLRNFDKDYTFGKIRISNDGQNRIEFDIKTLIYEIKSKKIAKRQQLGVWKSENPTSFLFDANMESLLSKLKAKTLYRIVTVLQPPFMMQNELGNFEGYCIDLINELKDMMGFEYEITIVEEYGKMNEKLEWNGMIRELVEKKADIALGALSVMAERENVVDFTVPYYDLVGISILMKKPKVPTSLFKFLSVLEDSVWICILAAYVITSLIMWIFDKWSPYSYQNNLEKYENDEEKRFFDLKECLWFCMTSLTPQGGGEAPKNLSGRLVAATWWLFGFIIIASYTANLAAFLTVSRLETPVESLEDLAKQYKIKYAPKNGSASATYFERMAYIEEKFYGIWKDMSLNDSLSELERSKLAVWDYPVSDKYTKIWQSMQETKLPITDEEAYSRVRASPSSSEGFAFLGDATDIRYQTLTNCDLQMVGEEFSRKPYALAVQQGSPLKDQLNDAILKLLNQRKLETLKERWWNQNPKKRSCDDNSDQGGGISIHNIGGVFIVIFVGIGLAILTLGFEYWYYKYKNPSKVSATDKEKNMNVFENKKFSTEYTSRNVAPVVNQW